MSNGFKISLALVALVGLVGFYILIFQGPSATLTSDEEARAAASVKATPKKTASAPTR